MAIVTASTVGHLEALPRWARELSEKYYSRNIAMFVLYGNVRDFVPFKRGESTELLGLPRFLNEALFGQRDLVLTYDRGGGLTFANSDMQADFVRALSGYDSFHGTSYAAGLPRNPDGVLNLLDNYLRLRITEGGGVIRFEGNVVMHLDKLDDPAASPPAPPEPAPAAKTRTPQNKPANSR